MMQMIKMKEIEKTVQSHLKQPYSRVVIPDEESGTFTAQILEFPGCITEGKSVQEAYERLEETASSWIETALELKQDIPVPMSISNYGGKFALRLPKSLHRQAAIMAEQDGTSLNQFIVTAIAEKVGATRICDQLAERLEHHIYQMSLTTALRFVIANYVIQEQAANWPSKSGPYMQITNMRPVLHQPLGVS